MPNPSKKLIDRYRRNGWLSISEAARLTGLHCSTIRKWCALERLLSVRFCSMYFVHKASLLERAGIQ